ncbi:hypothetical protein LUZ60_008562 [Juncus effusus]|nr:hypothetical protein LUZ60_008562 [Juncus effusus]
MGRNGKTAPAADQAAEVAENGGGSEPDVLSAFEAISAITNSTEETQQNKELSASAKKRKKKKEKEKQKNAASVSSGDISADVTSSKGSKKGFTLKGIREMQQKQREEEERIKREEEERLRREEEERERELERERQAELAKQRKREKEKERKSKKKQESLLKSQETKLRRLITNTTINNSSNNNKSKPISSTGSESDPSNSHSTLRSPVCCVLGHTDSGKTKLLDNITKSNIQLKEAGGITQQISATYLPIKSLKQRIQNPAFGNPGIGNSGSGNPEIEIPGLVVIDTPGHEHFRELRSRGSGICDVAVLVVDLMSGLEKQSVESLEILKRDNVEFVVALNKVDRIYGWKECGNESIIEAMEKQNDDVKRLFEMRVNEIIMQFKEQGINTELYGKELYYKKIKKETFVIVPTSAKSGEGISDLLFLLVKWAQKKMEKRLTYVDQVQGAVLEVKMEEGHGPTIDVILINGTLYEGDQIVVCGIEGPIVTNIRALMTPQPIRELQTKGTYQHHKEIKAAQVVKISGSSDLKKAIAGSPLYAVKPSEDLIAIKNSVMSQMNNIKSKINKSGEGVYIQASSLGSLEALANYLNDPKINIPFFDFNIGPICKNDVIKARANKKKEFGVILAFNVEVNCEARQLAVKEGIRVLVADVIYHLFDKFEKYVRDLRSEKKCEAIFPCLLEILPDFIIRKKDPIILGVKVKVGVVKVGTPICCIFKEEITEIGRIKSIEINGKQLNEAKKGQEISVKIENEEKPKIYGRDFDSSNELVSRISRNSIDALKVNYKDNLSDEEWNLVKVLKKKLKII